MARRPTCRPKSSHDWQQLPGNAKFAVCTKCDRLATRQTGGRLANRGRIKVFNYPEMEAMIRRRATESANEKETTNAHA